MQETDQATYFIDPLPPGQPPAAGRTIIRGWAVGKPGWSLTDLRVRSGQRISPAVYGFPRADLAQYFKTSEPFLLAGFEAEVELAPGDNELLLEVCESRGRWLPLAKLCLTAGPATAPAPTNLPEPFGAAEFARALRLMLQAPSRNAFADATETLIGQLPSPVVTRFPALPFHGHLHQPLMLQRAEFGQLIVEGWLFHESQAIRRVVATIDLHAWTELELGREHPYVAGQYPQFPQARTSRIEGFIDVPSQLPQPVSLRTYAELADGSWHLCHIQRVCLLDGESGKASYGQFNPVRFIRAAIALRRSLRWHRFAGPAGLWLGRALREVWTEYRERADARLSRKAPARAGTTPPPAGGLPPRQVVLVTHNLNYEGAPLFLVEYAAHLRSAGTSLTVVSAADGPLRERFATLADAVAVVEAGPLVRANTQKELTTSLESLAAQLDWSRADLVVANTLSAFWGVLCAERAGRPSLLYIHESTTPDAFFRNAVAPVVVRSVKDALARASHISFLTEATRRYYRPNLVRANHSINPGWLDLTAIRCFQAEHPREALRARWGLPPGTRFVINLGSVCDRKGQHIFARAVDLLWRRHPEIAGTCRFVMVGARPTSFNTSLEKLLLHLRRDNLVLLPETSEPYAYYGAADLFVCSSYEESFPRVILEAMAFGLPIVSSGVHGVPEMARADREAVLVNPGDSSALCDAMVRLLRDPAEAGRLAASAHGRVAEYDALRLLPRHAALASAVAARQL